LKSVYTAVFSRRREAAIPIAALIAVSMLGLVAAWFVR